MHEMGIVIETLDTLRSVMKDNKIKKLVSVTMSIGEGSMVVNDFFRECWEAAIPDTEFKDTKLKIESVVCNGKCNHCGTVFPIQKNKQKCPQCGAVNDFIPVSGLGIEIKEIEAE
jgi:hydrogenase nickel incorporation protein HypA/HybF